MCERQGERHVSRQKGGRRRKGKSPLIFQLWWPAIPNIPAPSSFSFFAVLLCRFFFTASVRGEKARGPLPCSIQLEIMHIPMSLVPWEPCFTFISLIPLPRQKGDRNIYDTLQCNLKKLLSSFHIYFWSRQNNDGSLCTFGIYPFSRYCSFVQSWLLNSRFSSLVPREQWLLPMTLGAVEK